MCGNSQNARAQKGNPIRPEISTLHLGLGMNLFRSPCTKAGGSSSPSSSSSSNVSSNSTPTGLAQASPTPLPAAAAAAAHACLVPQSCLVLPMALTESHARLYKITGPIGCLSYAAAHDRSDCFAPGLTLECLVELQVRGFDVFEEGLKTRMRHSMDWAQHGLHALIRRQSPTPK